MYKFSIIVLFFISQATFTAQAISSTLKPCETIAKACLKAGYLQRESGYKTFWMDCMKPILMGKSVENVKIDQETIQSCRSVKIDALRKELNDFESVRK